MRRIMTALAASSAAVVLLAMPAAAAKGQVTHERSSGTNVVALWSTTSKGVVVDTFVSVSASKKTPPQLEITRLTNRLDSHGNFLSGVVTSAQVSSGFTFTYDATKLRTASVKGTNLPARTCVINKFGDETRCSWGTVSLTASWAATGPISKNMTTEHFSSGGFKTVIHSSGRSREATATATLNGKRLANLQFASLGTFRYFDTTMCRVPTGCEGGL